MMLYSHGECDVNSNNSIEFQTASHTPVTKPVLDEILLDQDSHLLSPLGMFWLLADCCYKPGPGSTCHQSQPAANTRHNYYNYTCNYNIYYNYNYSTLYTS